MLTWQLHIFIFYLEIVHVIVCISMHQELLLLLILFWSCVCKYNEDCKNLSHWTNKFKQKGTILSEKERLKLIIFCMCIFCINKVIKKLIEVAFYFLNNSCHKTKVLFLNIWCVTNYTSFLVLSLFFKISTAFYVWILF